jgi:hypothetical protein
MLRWRDRAPLMFPSRAMTLASGEVLAHTGDTPLV